MEKVKITEHAYQRAKERCGWNRSATKRMYGKIRENGVPVLEGNISSWDKRRFEREGSSESRIYGNMVFIIKDEKLVTMYRFNGSTCAARKESKRRKCI